MDVHRTAVLEDERDRVGDEQPEDDQAEIEARLPAIADFAGVDPWAAQAHAGILRARRLRGPARAGGRAAAVAAGPGRRRAEGGPAGRAAAVAAAPADRRTERGTSGRSPRREGRKGQRGGNSNLHR